METQSYKWAKDRRGKFTGSELFSLMSEPPKGQKGLSAGAKTYIKKVLCTVLAEPKPDFSTEAMAEGNLNEPIAIDLISERLGVKINYYGNENPVFNPYGDFAGASPDGDFELDGMLQGVEVKCPMQEAHLDHLLIQTPEDLYKQSKKYFYQCHLNMLALYHKGCRRWWFASYNKYFYKEEQHLHMVAIDYDAAVHEAINKKIEAGALHMQQLLKDLGI